MSDHIATLPAPGVAMDMLPELKAKKATKAAAPEVPPVAILSKGSSAWASARYRGAWLAESAPDLFRWFGPETELALAGAKVIVFQKRQSHEDIVLARRAKDKGVAIVMDMTDPMWWFDPEPVAEMIDLADAVTVCSEGMQEAVLQGHPDKRVAAIADRMLPSFHPTVAQHEKREVATLVWFGIATNRVALTGALPILAYAQNMGLKFRLRIIDDEPTNRLNVTGPFEIEHVPWTLETIHAQLTACDVAVLPPYPGPWGELKSNNKAVTAWWCGLPVTDGFDPKELARLIGDADCRKEQGAFNRKRAEREYDIAQSVAEWRQLLKELGVRP